MREYDPAAATNNTVKKILKMQIFCRPLNLLAVFRLSEFLVQYE